MLNLEIKVLMADDVNLSWERFNPVQSTTWVQSLTANAHPYNSAILATKNFFVIAGLGAFEPGYILILPKQHRAAFAVIPDDQKEELDWLQTTVRDCIQQQYGGYVATFEHGACGCGDETTNAHIHLMPIPAISEEEFAEQFNKTCKYRAVGIRSLTFRGNQMTNRVDIAELLDLNPEHIDGNLLTYASVNHLEKPKKTFPKASAYSLMTQQEKGHYLYFASDAPYLHTPILASDEFGSQFGRELVFNICKTHRQDPTRIGDTWSWRDEAGDENMERTWNDLSSALQNSTQLTEAAKKFGLEFFDAPLNKEHGKNTLPLR